VALTEHGAGILSVAGAEAEETVASGRIVNA